MPIKPLELAKSRLLGNPDDGRTAEHGEFVTAVALDTVEAARRTPGVSGVVVVTSDPRLAERFHDEGVEVLPDTPATGLNAALRHGEAELRPRAGVRRIGALQADLPALRSSELAEALRSAGTERAFCSDRHGSGTTLLLAEPGRPLDPRFGAGSAAAHRASGAESLTGTWESLRCDVDTAEDLRRAALLGLGPRSRLAYHASARLAVE